MTSNSNSNSNAADNAQNQPIEELFDSTQVQCLKQQLQSSSIKFEDIEWQYVDGSIMEGGGQIIRNSFALSSLFHLPLCIKSIRAARSKPGYKHQHLAGVNFINKLMNGIIVGNELNSCKTAFYPREQIQLNNEVVDVQTAGSIGLLIQISLIPLLFSATEQSVKFIGGTNCDMAPHIDFLTESLYPFISKMGVDCNIKLEKRGFFPKGQGCVTLQTKPCKMLKPIQLVDQGTLDTIEITSYCTSNLAFLGSKMTKAAAAYFATNLPKATYGNYKVILKNVTETNSTAFGSGSGIIIVGKSSTGCIFCKTHSGSKKIKANRVATNAAAEFVRDFKYGGCFEEYLQDQLIIFMALANGKSAIKTGPLSMHTETAIYFLEKLTNVKFNVFEAPDKKAGEQSFIIECNGLAFENKFLK